MRIELTRLMSRFPNVNVTIPNFNVTIPKFPEKFDHQFLLVIIFGNMIPESHGFADMPVTSCIKDTYSNLSVSN